MSKSKVVLVRSKSLSSGAKLDTGSARSLLSAGIAEVLGCDDPREALADIARNTGRLGLKPNCVAGPMISTSASLVYALAGLLQSSGKRDSDIVIWDRSCRELQSAGFELNAGRSGVKCFGTDARDVGYGNSFHVNGKVGSLVTRIIEDECDHLINIPILKDHSVAGVSGGMKNYYGAVHNPNKYHGNNCDPYVAEVNALPVIKSKNVLTVMDVTRMQYHGGPGFQPQYVVNPGAVLLSTDPVAIDAHGERIINEYRAANGMKSLAESGRAPLWLKSAEKLGLGNAELSNIDLMEVVID
jgi:uncharacterized protein (DUF362 family)